MLGVIAGSLVAIVVRLWMPYFDVPTPSEIDEMKTEMKGIRQALSDIEMKAALQVEPSAEGNTRATTDPASEPAGPGESEAPKTE